MDDVNTSSGNGLVLLTTSNYRSQLKNRLFSLTFIILKYLLLHKIYNPHSALMYIHLHYLWAEYSI